MQKKQTMFNYRFVTMKQPLKFDVRLPYGGIAIPAGTRSVDIAFGQSSFVRDVETGRMYRKDFNEGLEPNEARCNVYRRHNGKVVYHA